MSKETREITFEEFVERQFQMANNKRGLPFSQGWAGIKNPSTHIAFVVTYNTMAMLFPSVFTQIVKGAESKHGGATHPYEAHPNPLTPANMGATLEGMQPETGFTEEDQRRAEAVIAQATQGRQVSPESEADKEAWRAEQQQREADAENRDPGFEQALSPGAGSEATTGQQPDESGEAIQVGGGALA